ncbi:type II toxin-antitoxin system RelE/ParE family toxin [Candidatus Woesearchaeota archaeon]|nr:type II toxin-antitoxin system RelE/ParE family toxin [Candidatus Woesearchaeota archaeon]
MTYEIKIKPKAQKQLKKLPKEVTERILKKIIFIKDTPQSFMKKLESKDIWSLRIGDYRALIDIFENKKLMEIVKVGHRKEVYKDLEEGW